MPMFTDVEQFKNNDVRLALKHAIDRKALVQTILLGHGVPGNDSPITPANKYFAKDIPIREYDPEKAKFHLKQAGLVDAEARPVGGGCGVQRRRRYCRAVQGARGQGRHRHQRRPRAQRRLLVQRVAEEAVRDVLLGGAADGGLDVQPSLRQGLALERYALGAREVQRAAARGPLQPRRGQARATSIARCR